MCSGHQHKHNGYCYVVFYYSSFFKHREKGVFFSSSVEDQGHAEVSGHFFQQPARKHLYGFHLAGPFLWEKKPGVLGRRL